MSKRPFVLGGTNRGRGHKRMVCPRCGKRGLGALKQSSNGPFFNCQYCLEATLPGADGKPLKGTA